MLIYLQNYTTLFYNAMDVMLCLLILRSFNYALSAVELI